LKNSRNDQGGVGHCHSRIADRKIRGHTGNKRIGYVMMRFFLLQNKMDIKATQIEKYDFVMSIANGKIEIEEITGWIEGRAASV